MQLNFDSFYIEPIQLKDAWNLCDFIVSNEDRLKRYFPKTLSENLTPTLSQFFVEKKVRQFNLKEEFLFTLKEQNTNAFVGLVYIKELDWDKKITENIAEPFLEYNEGFISIEDFIKKFNTSNFLKDFKSKKEYANYLHTKVSQSIRDIFLAREAKLNNLQESPLLQKDLELWKNKWVYEELCNRIVFNSSVKKTAQDNIKTTLSNKIKKLKNIHKVEIYESILDTINVIDFEKSKWASMQILKYGSNRPAYPVVDPRLELILN